MADDPKADPTQAVAPDPGQAGADGTQQAGGDQGVKAAGGAGPSQEGATAEAGTGPTESVWQQRWNADHGELTKVQAERNRLREEKEALQRERDEATRRFEEAEAARRAAPAPAPAPRPTEPATPTGDGDDLVVASVWDKLDMVKQIDGDRAFELAKVRAERDLNRMGKSLYGAYAAPRAAAEPRPAQVSQQPLSSEQLQALVEQQVAQSLQRTRQTETATAATISRGLSTVRQSVPQNPESGMHFLDETVQVPADAPPALRGQKLSREQLIREFMQFTGEPNANIAWARVDPEGYESAVGERRFQLRMAEAERQRAAAGLPPSAPMVPVDQFRGSERANAEAVAATGGLGSLKRPE